MDLELRVSGRMSRSREEGVIRVTPRQAIHLDVRTGQRLSVTTFSGTKLSLLVKPAHPEDCVTDARASYVCQKDLDSITGSVERPLETTLGCDPEFVFVNSSQSVFPASYWLPTWGPIGSDGPLAELRPLPAIHEDGVVENLRKLIRTLPLLTAARFGSPDTLVPRAHSCWHNHAIGFHIHLGAPKELLTHAAPGTNEFLGNFITAIDYFVGIPAMLLEDSNVRRLGDGAYGKPGDYRLSSKTIEYRTPGGFHLRHPHYAAGIMGLALCVGQEILSEYRQLSNNWRSLDRVSGFEHIRKRFNLPTKREIRWALTEPTKRVGVKQLPNILRQLQGLENFKNHRESIGTYFKLVANNTQYSPNLLQNW
jgi:hypothetical protein